MKVELIYSTPNYHKLVETVARVCYQSYHKDDVNSHNFIKAIMAKGHISVASVGNLVFELSDYEYPDMNEQVLYELMEMQQVNQFIKWTLPYSFKQTNRKTYVSMNMLTFLDLNNTFSNANHFNETFSFLKKQVDKVPHLKWFYDKSVELSEIRNEYTAKGMPSLYKPIILDEDYTTLKALGLNDYELGIHATITMNFITDRSASLQFWRHWAGGCELSQRYVERGNAEFRGILGIDDITLKSILGQNQLEITHDYEQILKRCEQLGIRKGRAKEIARSILPNSITTQLIQSRPYRNWMHLFKLRDSKHAQREIQEDVIHIKRVLNEIGVPTE